MRKPIRAFADLLPKYLRCSVRMQRVILEMIKIVHSIEATADERTAALTTIEEKFYFRLR